MSLLLLCTFLWRSYPPALPQVRGSLVTIVIYLTIFSAPRRVPLLAHVAYKGRRSGMGATKCLGASQTCCGQPGGGQGLWETIPGGSALPYFSPTAALWLFLMLPSSSLLSVLGDKK